jgi:hypothetical protein
MELYPDRMVADVARLAGASHSYLKQLCTPDAADVRARLQRCADDLSEPLAARVVPLLTSLDNRRFFQGFAEVSAIGTLARGGWAATHLVAPGPRIALAAGGRPTTLLSVLAFLHQTRPGGDAAVRDRLRAVLERVATRMRFAVLIRRWLPHDFDPEPVRQAVQMWLAEVEAGRWQGRYAAYEDEHVALELCLTGERLAPDGSGSPVALMMGPFLAHRTLEVVEPRVVQELDRHVASAERSEPLIVACVSDQPWLLSPGYVRDFLYGRPRSMSFGEGASEVEVGGSGSPCVFRDPLYDRVSAVLFVDRDPFAPGRVRARGYLNPYARAPVAPSAIGAPSFGPVGGARPRTTDDVVRMRWYDDHSAEVELGCTPT